MEGGNFTSLDNEDNKTQKGKNDSVGVLEEKNKKDFLSTNATKTRLQLWKSRKYVHAFC